MRVVLVQEFATYRMTDYGAVDGLDRGDAGEDLRAR
jgi:hypothetical protein